MKPERELIYSLTKKDFNVQYFRSSGAGGQHRNKTDSACRITHPESGAVGEATERRSQHQNKAMAFRRLTGSAKFKIWHTRKVNEILNNKSIDEEVEELMDSKYLKVEAKDEKGKWRLW